MVSIPAHSGERFSMLECISECVVSHRLWAGQFTLACSPSGAAVWQEKWHAHRIVQTGYDVLLVRCRTCHACCAPATWSSIGTCWSAPRPPPHSQVHPLLVNSALCSADPACATCAQLRWW